MAYPDPLIFGYRIITVAGGSPLPNRAILNLVSGFTASDNVGTQATDITASGAGGGVSRSVFRVAGSGSVSTQGREAVVFADPGNGGSGGGTPTVNIFTVSPQDGDLVEVYDTTRTINGGSQKIAIAAGGAPVGDPSGGGVFSTSPVYLIIVGSSARFRWDATIGHACLA